MSKIKKHLKKETIPTEILDYPEAEHDYICAISEYIRYVAVIACFLFPLAGIAHAIWTLDEYIWYEILLYGIAGEVAWLAFVGLLLLVLKPLFFFARFFYLNKVKRSEEQKGQKERALMCVPQLLDADPRKQRLDDLAQNYFINVEQIQNNRIRYQKLRAKREKYAEWKWVSIGIIAAAIVLWVAYAFIMLAVAFVLVMVIAAFLSVHPDWGESRHHKSPERYEEKADEYPWFIRLYEYIKTKDQKAQEEMRHTLEIIRQLESDNAHIISELQDYNGKNNNMADETNI